MAEYLSIFISGFEDTVMEWIPRELGGAKILFINGGLAYFKYAGKPEYVARLPFINNSFVVIDKYSGAGLTFEKMVYGASKKTLRTDGAVGGDGGGSFRVRFSRENTFEKVPIKTLETAEQAIIRNYKLYTDRLRPQHEYWFIIRRGEPGFFTRLLNKDAGAKPQKGELRQELASLLCLDCRFDKNTVVCDPFAGYGAIPLCIQKHHTYAKLYVNDSDKAQVAGLRNTRLNAGSGVHISNAGAGVHISNTGAGVHISNADAVRLSHIGDGEVDLVITDPPWGLFGNYGDINEFYFLALTEIKRLLKPSGTAVLLTGAPQEMAAAAKRAQLSVSSRKNILVNGKKATVFKLTKIIHQIY